MIININFREQKITEVFPNKSVLLAKGGEAALTDYYVKNYDRVRTNVIDDELVGWEYDNLCTIEELVPKVKELKMCCR